jgi:hypothetical protein
MFMVLRVLLAFTRAARTRLSAGLDLRALELEIGLQRSG